MIDTKERRKDHLSRCFWSVAFWGMAAFYLFLLTDFFFRVFLIAGGGTGTRSLNVVPLRTILEYASGQSGVSRSLTLYNLLGNVALFVPFGLYQQALTHGGRIGRGVLVALAASALVEAMQYALERGAADIDDVLLNTLGALIGIGCYRMLRGCENDACARRRVTIVSLAIGLPVLAAYIAIAARRFG